MPRINPLALDPHMLHKIRAEQGKRSFYRFVQNMWDTIIFETPVWNWHIQFLCNEIQRLFVRVKARQKKEYDVLVINVPPGSSKSTIASVMLPPWAWCVDPTIRVICGSYSSPLSLDLASKSKDVVTSTKYQLYYPTVKIRDDRSAVGHFKNTSGGERFSTSVGGSVTGMHGHIIVVDDPLNPMEAEATSETSLKAANQWLDKTVSSRCVDKETTPIILIMQRLHQADSTGHVLEQGETGKLRVRHVCLPAEINEYLRPKQLGDRYVDGLLDPVRMNRQVLDTFRVRLGTYGYSSQFDQSPIPVAGGLFNPENFEVTDPVNPSHLLRSVRFWDKAGTAGGGAYTVGVLMHQLDDGRFLVADVCRGQWSVGTREGHIKSCAQQDGLCTEICVEQEPGSGGLADAQMTIVNLAGFRAFKQTANSGKEFRAMPFAAQVEAGNVLIYKKAWTKAYLEELKYFPNSKYKDQVDASSGAFDRLTRGNLVGVF